MTFRRFIFSLAVLLLATAPLALAQGTYTQIDYPGAAYTIAQAVDTEGDIVGDYGDGSGQLAGFLLHRGTYTTIYYPGARETFLLGISDVGEIVGYKSAYGQQVEVGFSYDVGSHKFATIQYPGATATYPLAVNNHGTVGGQVSYNSAVFGFGRASTYKPISPRGMSDIQVTGVSASGELAGLGHTSSGVINFLFSAGQFSFPIIPNAPGAALYAINPAGTALVGSYTPTTGVTAGFLYQSNTLQKLQFPGSNATYPSGINSAGEVVGTFVDASNVFHGFTWTPSAAAAKK
jgi:hypothetical protein